MSMVDELERLASLRASGVLSDDEFQRAKAALIDGSAQAARSARPAGASFWRVDRLRRSADDRWIGGVCGGIGSLTGTEGWIWRLLFALGLLAGGAGGVLYLLMWILVPSENDAP
ncbi:MAG: PspC domain-containing protein [Quisquiliibacterium sp.]